MHGVSNTYLYGSALLTQRRQRVTKAVCSASRAGCFCVPDLHGAMWFKICRRETAASTLDLLFTTPSVLQQRTHDAEGYSMHSQTISRPSQLRKRTGCPHTPGITPTGASTRGTSGNMNPASTNLPHLAELPVRGIVEAARIVANVVVQPGDFYAGMRRRWLLHLGELTFESEGTISYRNSLMFLRDRRIVEATGTVGNVVAPCGEMSARIAHIIMSALRIDIKKKPS